MNKSPQVQKQEWDKLATELRHFMDSAEKDPSCRVFFHGIQVHHIAIDPAVREDYVELLGIRIYAVGDILDHTHYDTVGVNTQHCIAYFHRWRMTIEEIRSQLQHLEVRKVDIVKSFTPVKDQ